MFPIYWQGSVVGAIMGALLIGVLMSWLICSKQQIVQDVKMKWRVLIGTAAMVAWLGSFVNIGIHHVQGDRASFDQVGMMVDPNTQRVERKAMTVEDVNKAAAALRKEIDAGNLDK